MAASPAPMRTHGATTGTKADGFRRLEVITGIGRRWRWTDEEKARIVAESLDPATTASAVARRYGLHASQLFVWRQRFAAPAPAAREEAPTFVPVMVTEDGSAPAEMTGRMEIALGPAVVRVGVDVEKAGFVQCAVQRVIVGAGALELDGALRSGMAGEQRAEAVDDRLLVGVELEVHGHSLGSPSTRLAIRLSCTSVVPTATPAVIARRKFASASEP